MNYISTNFQSLLDGKTNNNLYYLNADVNKSYGCLCNSFISNIFNVNLVIQNNEKTINCYLHQYEFAKYYRYNIYTTAFRLIGMSMGYKIVVNMTC